MIVRLNLAADSVASELTSSLLFPVIRAVESEGTKNVTPLTGNGFIDGVDELINNVKNEIHLKLPLSRYAPSATAHG